jgi:hypothetical protein
VPRTVPTPAQLEYAQTPVWHRSPGLRRAILTASLVALIAVSLKWLGPAWDHARLLHHQSLCMAYTAPADRVVLAGPSPYQTAPCWRDFYAVFSPPGRKDLTTVFLHELRKKDGTRRLVTLEASANWGNSALPDSEVDLEYHVIAPATPWTRAKLIANAEARPYFYHESGLGKAFQIHAGQPDPNDSTHFTIELTWKKESVTVDGWLRDDDTILLEPRDRLERLQVSKY